MQKTIISIKTVKTLKFMLTSPKFDIKNTRFVKLFFQTLLVLSLLDL